MKFPQSMIEEIQNGYCVEGLSPYKLADEFDTTRDHIRGLVKRYGWVKAKVDTVIRRVRKRKLEKETRSGYVTDRGVKAPSQDWPADARFDRPGMVVTFKIKPDLGEK